MVGVMSSKARLVGILSVVICFITYFFLFGGERYSDEPLQLEQSNLKNTPLDTQPVSNANSIEKGDSMGYLIPQAAVETINNIEANGQDTIEPDNVPVSEAFKIFTGSIGQVDERSPPIVRQKEEEKPTQEELDDPDKYLEFQLRQRKKVLFSYLDAAKPKLKKLRELVAEGERRGISEDKLIEGQTKILKIEEMVSQILEENPDIAELASSDDIL